VFQNVPAAYAVTKQTSPTASVTTLTAEANGELRTFLRATAT
jgi:hypothetical protein